MPHWPVSTVIRIGVIGHQGLCTTISWALDLAFLQLNVPVIRTVLGTGLYYQSKAYVHPRSTPYI